MANIIIYGNTTCPHCNKAREVLGNEGNTIEFKDITDNKDLLEEMKKLTGGHRAIPVIVKEGKVSIGFGGT